jgi:cobaltochelatase CobN
VVRLLGGLDWWKYGIERLSALARERGIALAVLPGEDRDDARLAAASTLPPKNSTRCCVSSAKAAAKTCARLLRRLARHAGRDLDLARAAAGAAPCRLSARRRRGRSRSADSRRAPAGTKPVVPIIFYRAMLLAADTAPIDALCAALAARPRAGRAMVITSLKDRDAAAFLRGAFARLDPAVIVTTTAFAAGGKPRSRRRSTSRAFRCCRSSARPPSAPRGATARAGSAPPISPCTWCCPSSMAACWPARSRSRIRCRRRKDLPSPRLAAAPSRIASPRRRSHCRAGAPARAAARRAARRDADAGLSRRAGTHRLCGRPRRAGERDRVARRSRRRRLHGERRAEAPRELLDALAAAMQRSRSNDTKHCSRVPARGRARSAKHGASRRTIPTCATARSASARKTFGKLLVALPPDRGRSSERRADYHDPRCRRGMRWSPSGFGCNTSPKLMRSFTWARTARWNGCRARRSR